MSDKERIMLYTSSELKTALKVHCAKTDEKISAVVEKAIKEYLERYPVK